MYNVENEKFIKYNYYNYGHISYYSSDAVGDYLSLITVEGEDMTKYAEQVANAKAKIGV